MHAKRAMVDGHHPGRGVHRKSPDCYARGSKGVHGQLPELHGAGRGVSVARLPSLGNMRGVLGSGEGRWSRGAPRADEGPPTLEWMRALQRRLRRVRVVCGDWTRVLGDSVLGTTRSKNSGMTPCGVFLDAPYDVSMRDPYLYGHDARGLSADVAQWARERGDDPDLRIALCAYEGEHEMPASWRLVAWKGTRGYAGDDNDNRERERIWLSPHCLPLEDVQGSLFEAAR